MNIEHKERNFTNYLLMELLYSIHIKTARPLKKKEYFSKLKTEFETDWDLKKELKEIPISKSTTVKPISKKKGR